MPERGFLDLCLFDLLHIAYWVWLDGSTWYCDSSKQSLKLSQIIFWLFLSVSRCFLTLSMFFRTLQFSTSVEVRPGIVSPSVGTLSIFWENRPKDFSDFFAWMFLTIRIWNVHGGFPGKTLRPISYPYSKEHSGKKSEKSCGQFSRNFDDQRTDQRTNNTRPYLNWRWEL